MTFDEIYTSHKTLISAYIHDWENRDYHRAEDLIQNFYVYLIEKCELGKFDKFDDLTDLSRAHLVRVTLRNFLVNSDNLFQPAFERSHESNNDQINKVIIDDDPFDELRAGFDKILNILTTEQGYILRRLAQGVPSTQIANELGISEGAAWQRIRRSKAAAKALADQKILV